ncbi:hypothetical protein ACRRTK_014083 [Alexandromys fortis]
MVVCCVIYIFFECVSVCVCVYSVCSLCSHIDSRVGEGSSSTKSYNNIYYSLNLEQGW